MQSDFAERGHNEKLERPKQRCSAQLRQGDYPMSVVIKTPSPDEISIEALQQRDEISKQLDKVVKERNDLRSVRNR
ncbi:hypothetical protein Pyn_23563 [Prunus yedoensis var. nudiflora]|uniref:Uncharacterized protein n=1 Tax=Prunus yedoensis var. nudiflora TaxID=2094558 RepID=A0A314XU90_PRUYE|nr:hypothetical protein Pyn_23563 [Prunus yedoensis var. nudiflora]